LPAFPVLMLAVFGLTLFCSATLLFMVQPLVGKMITPLLGGTPEVWNTCMVFFQALLLAGYAYAHATTKYLGIRKQAALHLVVLLVPFLFLPISVNRSLIQGGVNPIPSLLLVLLFSVGMPFFVISTSAPLLQRWFSSTDHPSAKDPYFLYGASNLGSMLALISYPVVVEPLLKLGSQTTIWAVGYGCLVALIFACAYCLLKSAPAAELAAVPAAEPAQEPVAALAAVAAPAASESIHSGKPAGNGVRGTKGRKHDRRVTTSARGVSATADPKTQTTATPPEAAPTPTGREAEVTMARRVRWVLLSAVPSSMMLGATTYITTDLAPIPLLWVLPLALYLLSFIIVFAKVSQFTQSLIVFVEALAVWGLGMTRVYPLVETTSFVPLFWIVGLALFAGSVMILFLRDEALNHKAMILALPLLVLLVIFMMLSEIKPGIVDTIALHLLMLFVIAMVCHGELARDRPAPSHLTEFFLLMSVGGVLGGLFNALIAPMIFNSLAEYQVAMVVACLLLPPLTTEKGSSTTLIIDLSLAGLFLVFGVTLIGLRIYDPRYVLSAETLLQRTDFLVLLLGAVVLGVLGGLWMVWRDREERLARILDMVLPLTLLVLMVGLILGIYSNIVDAGLRKLVYNPETNTDGVLPLSLNRLRLILMYGLPAVLCYTFVERSLRFGLGVGAILIAASFCNQFEDRVLLQKRSFFGVLVVEKDDNYHRLVHGTTLHGKQFIDERLRDIPLTYYHRTGPIGQIMAAYNDPENPKELPKVGLIGLGTGTMACYARKDQEFTFYDIDPLVKKIAQNKDYFTYWSDAVERGAKLNLRINDARLEIERQVADEPDRPEEDKYSILVVDAFSSDAIPIHLITKEALEVFLKMMRQDGKIAFHVSNRYLDLKPVLANLAQEEGLAVYYNSDDDEDYPGKTRSTWVVLARDEKHLERLWTTKTWLPRRKELQGVIAPLVVVPDGGTGFHNLALGLYGASETIKAPWRKAETDPKVGVWTDDYSNLLSVFMWR
jgi:hypothetical protein